MREVGFIVALNEDTAKRLFKKLNDLQKQIEEIQNELLVEMDSEELTPEEMAEIKAIKEENDYRTLTEWARDGLEYQLDVEKD